MPYCDNLNCTQAKTGPPLVSDYVVFDGAVLCSGCYDEVTTGVTPCPCDTCLEDPSFPEAP